MVTAGPAGRPAIISGDRADGTQQRLLRARQAQALRWPGIPGWNPATELKGRQGKRKK